jgi:hypothetical protein
MMAAPVTAEPTFSSGAPRELFEGNYHWIRGLPSYDVTPDGRRFLMIKENAPGAATSGRPELVVVLNWSEELKRKAPAR